MFAKRIAELKLLILNQDKKYIGVLEHLTEMFEADTYTYAGVLQNVALSGISKEGAAFYEKAVSILPENAKATCMVLYELYAPDKQVTEKLLKSIMSMELVFLGDDLSLDVYNKCLYHSFFVTDTDMIDKFMTKLNQRAGEENETNH